MLWLLSGPSGFTCWISFVQYSGLCTAESLSLFYLLFYMFYEMMHGYVRGLCKPDIYVS